MAFARWNPFKEKRNVWNDHQILLFFNFNVKVKYKKLENSLIQKISEIFNFESEKKIELLQALVYFYNSC